MTKLIPILDTHAHFYDFSHPELKWDWLARDFVHPILGNIDPIKAPQYLVQDFHAESRFVGVTGVVHVQAAIGSPDPVTETEWLTEMNKSSPIPIRIVADCVLGGTQAIAQLEGHARSELFVGIRDFQSEPMLARKEIDSTFESSLKWLSQHEKALDLDCEWMNMAEARKLAIRHPDLQIVLEHIGFPRTRTNEYFKDWRKAINHLAKAENITMKISGIAMTDPNFTKKSLKPWVETCIEAFGPKRCVIGSNWPLDRLRSSYDTIINLYRDYVSTLSHSEQKMILNKNAAKIYRFDYTKK